MKKLVLFLSAVSIFTFIHAQQTITPNIQDLIQKRLKKEQDQKLRELNPFLRKADRYIVTLPNVTPEAQLQQTLADGSKVYALPQDNMPCVEPDMNKYNNMPNLAIQKRHQLVLPDNFVLPRGLGHTPNADILKKILPNEDIK